MRYSRATPALDRITDVWANYCLACDTKWDNCPHGQDSTTDDEERIRQKALYYTFIDEGEPECLSCRLYLGMTPEALADCYPDGGGEDERFWGERAHIVPWSYNHDDSPENVIPLCHNCHGCNPEQPHRRVYLDWLIDQRTKFLNTLAEVQQEFAIAHPEFSEQKVARNLSLLVTMERNHGKTLSDLTIDIYRRSVWATRKSISWQPRADG
jgi:hypothetical protein